MKKSVCLGLSIFDVSKTVMYEFWNDYIKPTYGENANFCYMDTDSFICLCKKLMMFTKTSQKMLKKDLALQTMK